MGETLVSKIKANFLTLAFYFQDIITYLVGITIILLALFIIVIIWIPVLIYRFIIEILGKLIQPDLASLVNTTGNIFTSDLFSKKPTRCPIVLTGITEGKLKQDDVHSLFQRLITLKNEAGQQVYPECQQYIENWCGYAFWKTDPSFKLENHLKIHEFATEDEVNALKAELLNKPFPAKKSPWEVHIVENYKDPNHPNTENLTLVLFRLHHCMADGYSILYALVEGLFQRDIHSIKLPKATFKLADSRKWILAFPRRFLKDVSNLWKAAFQESRFKIPDSKKRGNQIYETTSPVPVDKIKTIKNNLNVSFVSILLAAICKCLSKVHQDNASWTSVFLMLPVPGHPRALTNHCTATQVILPLKYDENPISRVYECERLVQEQKKSTVPLLLLFLWNIGGFLPSKLCGWLTSTFLRCCTVGATCFPAGERVISGERPDIKLHDAEAGVGTLTGVMGITFTTLSYRNHLKFSIAAEEAILSKEELKSLTMLLFEEIEILYNITKHK